MSAPKRYFINALGDFSGKPVDIPKEDLKEKCMNYVQQVFNRQRISHDDCDGGLYVGLAGVSYMCYYLSQHPEFSECKQEFLGKSAEYMKHALSYIKHPHFVRDKSMQASFLLGAGGTYAVAAALMNAQNNLDDAAAYLQKYISLADICAEQNFLKCGSDELFVGRAGYLCGTLFLQKTFGKQVVPEEKISALCEIMIKSGSEYSRKMNSPCPLMYAYYDTEYLGAGHGLSSILQMLLCFPNYLDKNPEAEQKVQSSVDYLLTIQNPFGNFPCAMDEVHSPRPVSNELLHWCHGAPGLVYLMAKAFLRWKNDKYLNCCLICGDLVWRKGLLKKGPGICHGVAGSGYVFLLLYRLTNDNKHLHRALKFANFLFHDDFKAARLPDSPLSLYEGLSGTVCFLADVLLPEKAAFPFFDIF